MMLYKTCLATAAFLGTAQVENQDLDYVSLLQQHAARKRVDSAVDLEDPDLSFNHEACTASPEFELDKIKYNNLGGVCGSGDCTGQPQEMRYENAAVIGGVSVDLVMTNVSLYQPANANLNGVELASEFYGQVNMLCGTGTEFLMSIVKSGTYEPVTVDAFAFSIYDVDSGKKHKGRESVQSCEHKSYLVSKNPASELEKTESGNCVTFRSTTRGNGKDNPTDPCNMTPKQLQRSAMFGFGGISQFKFRFSVAAGAKGSGRNVLFAGASPCQMCGEVTTTTTTTTCVSCDTFSCPETYSLRAGAESICGAERSLCCLKDGVCTGLPEGSKCGLGDISESKIPNPSFEEKTSCPTSHTQLEKAVGWHQATSATSDFWVQKPTCPSWYSRLNYLPPFPDGDGAVAAIKVAGNIWHEYVGACLLGGPTIEGVTYTMNIQINAGLIENNYGGDTDGETELMCIPSCTAGTFPISGRGWMGGQFTILDKKSPAGGLTLYGPWKPLTLEFVGPAQACQGIMFGPSLESSIQSGKSGSYTVYDFLNLQPGPSGKCDAQGQCVSGR